MGRDYPGTEIHAVPVSFQSTRPHGARPKMLDKEGFNVSFNPRARMGRDDILHLTLMVQRVSIHAPAWGATSAVCVRSHNKRFNPRARMGRDVHILFLV